MQVGGLSMCGCGERPARVSTRGASSPQTQNYGGRAVSFLGFLHPFVQTKVIKKKSFFVVVHGQSA